MSVVAEKQRLAKPFLKWAGGKGQLLAEIESRLPQDIKTGEIDTYVEPFVGGGAVFFHVAKKYEGVRKFFLFDVNKDLVDCYNAIKRAPKCIVRKLKRLENQFLSLDKARRKVLYYRIRTQFNRDKDPAKLIFLNKTCYNGLYRVNRQGQFNVPFGEYKNPRICDRENLQGVSELLQRVEIRVGDFTQSLPYVDDRTFVYFDPPYRPISPTANFTSYSKDSFYEKDQVRLAKFCMEITTKGAAFLLSNSDPKNENPSDRFFETNYPEDLGFHIDTVSASRAINCKPLGRGQINELLITNYEKGN